MLSKDLTQESIASKSIQYPRRESNLNFVSRCVAYHYNILYLCRDGNRGEYKPFTNQNQHGNETINRGASD
jgi:hypothetical protein